MEHEQLSYPDALRYLARKYNIEIKERELTEEEKQAARRQLTICEPGISKLEARCRQLDAEMEQNACDVEKLQELYREKQNVEAQLEQEMARWEELSLQLEE